MTVIDLSERRAEREGPDSNCIVRDIDGRPMFLFALDWEYDGRRWTVQIAAYDLADAEARVRSMRAGLEVAGMVVAQGSAPWFQGHPTDV